jgi:hypothetical protein
MDEFLGLVAACALGLKDVLAKANGIVRDFLVQFHNEDHPDMARPPQLHAGNHKAQRRALYEEEPNSALNHERRERNIVYANHWHRRWSFVDRFRRQ